MAVYNNVVVTDVGLTLLRDISLANRALNAANVVTSASVVSNPKTATDITNVVQSQSYTLFSQGTNSFVLEAQLTNAGVTTAYNLNTIGFFANDGVGGNVLLAVITAQTPDLIPPETSYPINLNFRAFIVIDSGGNVTVNASFAGYATMESLGEHMESIAESAGGVHGIRYSNDALQLKDGASWKTIAEKQNILRLTFAKSWRGKTFTVSGGGFNYAGTVPNNLAVDLILPNQIARYTITIDWKEKQIAVPTITNFGVFPVFLDDKFAPLNEITWSAINDIANQKNPEDYFNIGDEKDIVLSTGEILTLQIWGFKHDDAVDGSGNIAGKAGITFGLKHLMQTARRINNVAGNNTAFPTTEINQWVNNTLFSQMPGDLTAVIQKIKKNYVNKTAINVWTLAQSDMNIFIPAIGEVTTVSTQAFILEANLYELFIGMTAADRIKRMSNGLGSVNGYSTRSPALANNDNWNVILNTGITGGGTATTTRGVCFGFCVGLAGSNSQNTSDEIDRLWGSVITEDNLSVVSNLTETDNILYFMGLPVCGCKEEEEMGRSGATITIGTTAMGHTTRDVDVLCTGVNDQIVIQGAINSLPPTGGMLLFREGTYSITGQINITIPNVTIKGMGNSTRFVTPSSIQGIKVFEVLNHENIVFKDFRIELASTTHTGISTMSRFGRIDNIRINGGWVGITAANWGQNISNCNIDDSIVGIEIMGTGSQALMNANIIGNQILYCQTGIGRLNDSNGMLENCSIVSNIIKYNQQAALNITHNGNRNNRIIGNYIFNSNTSVNTVQLNTNTSIFTLNRIIGISPSITGTGNITDNNIITSTI